MNKHFKLISAIIAIILAAQIYTQDSTIVKFQRLYTNYALLIGINDYQDDQIMDLEFAHQDVNAIREILTNKFDFTQDHIKTLLDQDASLLNIRNAITEFYRTGENARIFLYFAGHGETVKISNGVEMGFLVPYDADLSSASSIHKTCLPMSELGSISQFLPSKHVLYLIDACYGGLAALNPRSGADYGVSFVEKMMQTNSRQIITAGGKNERVVERSSLGHSVFAKALIDGLEKELADLDNDRIIPASELYVYLKKQVSAYTYNLQTPIMRYFTPDEGEFVFILPPSIGYPGSASLKVESNAHKATVLINDRETPYRAGELIPNLRVGRNKITLKYNSHRIDREMDLQPGNNTISLNYTVCPVSFSTNISNPSITIDGETVSNAISPFSLIEGPHKVTFEKQGWRMDTNIIVLSDITNIVRADFPVGTLNIQSTSRDIKYTVDNRTFVSDTAIRIDNLLPGTYTVTAAKENSVYSKVLVIREGQEQTVSFEDLYKKERRKKWWYLAGGATAAAIITMILFNPSSSSGASAIKPPDDFFPTE